MKKTILSLATAVLLVGCGGSGSSSGSGGNSSGASSRTYIYNNISSSDSYANSLISNMTSVFSTYPDFKRKTFKKEVHCEENYGFKSSDLKGSAGGALTYVNNNKLCHEVDFSSGGNSVVLSWNNYK